MKRKSNTQNPAASNRGSVTAVLGPTNTGKTHLAIERLIDHETGIIGLPLRLLAREVYASVAEHAGVNSVALVTGEEKIIPEDPQYWVATVEAMPLDIEVDFIAIDEIQLASDLERGHVFTQRILNARGAIETLLLGSETIRTLLEQLLPGLNIIRRPRMSILTYNGSKKITRLPPRSAAVAFSSNEVYAIAELVRRQRGGAAVVLGSLSPRTRNAQVEMFQSGEVDILVATDAIGMGLNLNVNHIAFAGITKFDGQKYRELNPAELGQIAGRAGRHTQNGTFGVTGQVDPLRQELVETIESHDFETLKVIQWRNTNLNFSSISALYDSLNVAPRESGLVRAPLAQDVKSLEILASEENITQIADSEDRIRRLWEVCQLPDYRKISPANHAEMISTIFTYLVEQEFVPEDWLAKQISFADRTDGDIDTLANRISHVRTWTYVANRGDWLKDRSHWQEQTRSIEERLSDALHEQLIQRFVDRRTSVLQKKLRDNEQFEAEISSGGEVMVENHHIGHLTGFKFIPSDSGNTTNKKTFRTSAMKALTNEFESRAERVAKAPNENFLLSSDGIVRWLGEPIAKLTKGESLILPSFNLIADDQLTGAALDKVNDRMKLWIRNHFEHILKPLYDLSDDNDLSGLAKGMAFRLVENFGIVDRRTVAEEVRQLDQTLRATLRRLGVRFGAYYIYMPALLKPAQIQLIGFLWALKNEDLSVKGLSEIPQQSSMGRTTVPVHPDTNPELYKTMGYRVCGKLAIRIDILERLAGIIRSLVNWKENEECTEPPLGAIEEGGGFTVTPEIRSLLGCSGEALASILKAIGYKMKSHELKSGPKLESNTIKNYENDVEGKENKEQNCMNPNSSLNQNETGISIEHQNQSESTEISQNLSGTEKEPPSESEDVVNCFDQHALEVWHPVRFKKKGKQRSRKERDKNRNTQKNGTDKLRKSLRNQTDSATGKKPKRKKQTVKSGSDRNEKKTLDPKNSPFSELATLKEKLENSVETTG